MNSETGPNNSRLVRQVGVAVTAASLLMGGLYPSESEQVEHTVTSVSAPAGNEDSRLVFDMQGESYSDFQQNHAERAQVQADIQSALAVDTCEVKVTQDEVMGVFNRMYGPESAPSQDPALLMLQSTNVVEEVRQARSKLTFGMFPATEYKRLLNDGYSDSPQLPLSEYNQMTDDYISQRGVATLHDWQPGAPGMPDISIIPSRDEANGTDINARRAALETLGAFYFMPEELTRISGLQRVNFGDIRNIDTEGFVSASGAAGVASGTEMTINTAGTRNDDPAGLDASKGLFRSLAIHENQHMVHSLCWAATGEYKGDPALRALNQGIIYRDNLPEGDKDRVQNYQTLEDQDAGTVVFAKPYGQTSDAEEAATVVEFMEYGPHASKMYENDASVSRNKLPLEEKSAIIMARLNTLNPDLADFYIGLMRAGRLQAFSEGTIRPMLQEQNSLSSDSYRFQQLDTGMEPYFAVQDVLRSELAVGHRQD